MRKSRMIWTAIVLVAGTSIGLADEDVNCSGRVDVTDLNIGCDGEATRVVSLAKCDFRSEKQPNVFLSNVIDGMSGNQTVAIQSRSAGNFIVMIRPKPSAENVELCKVERFDWVAE